MAFALLLTAERGIDDRVEFEMLEGMAPAHARVVKDDGDGLLLYTPVVAPTDFEVAIGYLFRRLEENATDKNFIHRLFGMEPGSVDGIGGGAVPRGGAGPLVGGRRSPENPGPRNRGARPRGRPVRQRAGHRSGAARNAVVLKPAPQTPRCAEIVAECCWAAGVGEDVLHYLRIPDNDTGRHLIGHTGINGVILTGAFETAELFRSWRPDLRLFAETSGKNALVITPNADIDLAVADLAASAFGHSSHKYSAASLAICVGEMYDSPRLRRQLIDAVGSMEVGPAASLATAMGPMIGEPEGKLLRGLTRLDEREEWLLEPRRVGPRTWTPGIRMGVAPGSWFHLTECFGPVLGVMRADSLEQAVGLQNASPYGLTSGIHSLDDDEVGYWLERAEVGNADVNRAITGAIVRRKPFGGWKRSAVGPGAKAGGPKLRGAARNLARHRHRPRR